MRIEKMGRPRITREQKAALWERRKNGQSPRDITRAGYRPPPDPIVQDLETYQIANERKCTSRSSQGVHRAYPGATVPFKALKSRGP
jgi:hypothetical protein